MKRRRRPTRPPKGPCQAEHFKRRTLVRLGFGVSDAWQEKIRSAIHADRTTFVEKQSIRVTLHGVKLDGQPVIVVYDTQRRTLVTVIPLNDERYATLPEDLYECFRP